MKTMKMEFQKHIEKQLEEEVEEISIEQQWQNTKATLKVTADGILGFRIQVLRFKKQEKQKPWVTNQVLSKIEERKKCQNITTEIGKTMHKVLKINWIVCRKVHDKWWEKLCSEIKVLQKFGKHDKIHALIKKLTKKRKT